MNLGRNLRTNAAERMRLLGDHDPIGLLHGLDNRVDIQRSNRSRDR